MKQIMALSPEKYAAHMHNQFSHPIDGKDIAALISQAHLFIHAKPIATSFVRAAIRDVLELMDLPMTTKLCYCGGLKLPNVLQSDFLYLSCGTFQLAFIHKDQEYVYKVSRKMAEALAAIPEIPKRAGLIAANAGLKREEYAREMQRCLTPEARDALGMAVLDMTYCGQAFPMMRTRFANKDVPRQDADSAIYAEQRELMTQLGRGRVDPTQSNYKLLAGHGIVCVDADQAFIAAKPGIAGIHDSPASKQLRRALPTKDYVKFLKGMHATQNLPLVVAFTRLVNAYCIIPGDQTWFLTLSLLGRELSLSAMRSFFAKPIEACDETDMYVLSDIPFPAELDEHLLEELQIHLANEELYLGSAAVAAPFVAAAKLTGPQLMSCASSLRRFDHCPSAQNWLRLVYMHYAGKFESAQLTMDTLTSLESGKLADFFVKPVSECASLRELFTYNPCSKASQGLKGRRRRERPSVLTDSPQANAPAAAAAAAVSRKRERSGPAAAKRLAL